jgi:hypothetical protein
MATQMRFLIAALIGLCSRNDRGWNDARILQRQNSSYRRRLRQAAATIFMPGSSPDTWASISRKPEFYRGKYAWCRKPGLKRITSIS